MNRIQLGAARTLATSATSLLGVLAVGLLLSQTPLDAQASARFLRPSTATGDVIYRPQTIVGRLCHLVAGLRKGLPCPPTLTGRVPAWAFQPPPVLVADVPHLRMDLVLKRIENKVVSGLGVGNVEPGPPYYGATWQFSSIAATDEVNPVSSLPVPTPGQVMDVEPGTSVLFSGVIANGCSPATVFDASGHTEIVTTDPDGFFGATDVSDAVTGHGYYNFKYVVGASHAHGLSDFIFSGDANVYCTGKSTVP